MTFDLEKILQSKRAMRRDLAARPVAEKLAMLDVLRERALTLRAADTPIEVLEVLSDEKSSPTRSRQGPVRDPRRAIIWKWFDAAAR